MAGAGGGGIEHEVNGEVRLDFLLQALKHAVIVQLQCVPDLPGREAAVLVTYGNRLLMDRKAVSQAVCQPPDAQAVQLAVLVEPGEIGLTLLQKPAAIGGAGRGCCGCEPACEIEMAVFVVIRAKCFFDAFILRLAVKGTAKLLLNVRAVVLSAVQADAGEQRLRCFGHKAVFRLRLLPGRVQAGQTVVVIAELRRQEFLQPGGQLLVEGKMPMQGALASLEIEDEEIVQNPLGAFDDLPGIEAGLIGESGV